MESYHQKAAENVVVARRPRKPIPHSGMFSQVAMHQQAPRQRFMKIFAPGQARLSVKVQPRRLDED
jgi:hypothetical protein